MDFRPNMDVIMSNRYHSRTKSRRKTLFIVIKRGYAYANIDVIHAVTKTIRTIVNLSGTSNRTRNLILTIFALLNLTRPRPFHNSNNKNIKRKSPVSYFP